MVTRSLSKLHLAKKTALKLGDKMPPTVGFVKCFLRDSSALPARRQGRYGSGSIKWQKYYRGSSLTIGHVTL